MAMFTFFFQVFLIFGSSKEGWILIYSESNLFWYAVLVEVYEDYPTSHVGSWKGEECINSLFR